MNKQIKKTNVVENREVFLNTLEEDFIEEINKLFTIYYSQKIEAEGIDGKSEAKKTNKKGVEIKKSSKTLKDKSPILLLLRLFENDELIMDAELVGEFMPKK